MTNIIEMKKKPLPSQQKKLEALTEIVEIIESLDKRGDIEKLKKSQTIRISSKSGKQYIFTVTLI